MKKDMEVLFDMHKQHPWLLIKEGSMGGVNEHQWCLTCERDIN